jgi:hypothetical protein
MPNQPGTAALTPVTPNDELGARLARRRGEAFESWERAVDVVTGVFTNLLTLAERPSAGAPELDRERLRLEAVLRTALHAEEVAKRLLDGADATWHQWIDEQRWRREVQVQRSTAHATWAAVLVAVAVALPAIWQVARDLLALARR